jgi:antitoxin (DNA-binding transcriptional repressor) of toxin-antitoxin stability system
VSTHTVYDAETHSSSLIDHASAGEEIMIARGKPPLVKPPPSGNPGQRGRFGAMRGQAMVGEAYFDPLPEDELAPYQQ